MKKLILTLGLIAGLNCLYAGPLHIADSLTINIPDKTASPFTISFKKAEGATYTFQASSDLSKWSSLQEIEGTGNEVKVTDWREALFQQQYYRVKLVE